MNDDLCNSKECYRGSNVTSRNNYMCVEGPAEDETTIEPMYGYILKNRIA